MENWKSLLCFKVIGWLLIFLWAFNLCDWNFTFKLGVLLLALDAVCGALGWCEKWCKNSCKK